MGGSCPVQVLYKNKIIPPIIIKTHFFAGFFSFMLIEARSGKKVVVGVGFEPTNARSGRIYSPHPLATWIPYQQRKRPIMF